MPAVPQKGSRRSSPGFIPDRFVRARATLGISTPGWKKGLFWGVLASYALLSTEDRRVPSTAFSLRMSRNSTSGFFRFALKAFPVDASSNFLFQGLARKVNVVFDSALP